ncbi:hypothetical protein OB905_10705 [Halobacteria archaeon AArc-dxtr1]|nr:hypothetical protein [Halobacteria archaeon AArc-dxtr1]
MRSGVGGGYQSGDRSAATHKTYETLVAGSMRTVDREMMPGTHRRQLLAITTPIACALAAAIGWYGLVIGPSPAIQQVVAGTVPALFGLDPVTVAALAPAVVVSVGATLAVVLEVWLQLVAARSRRLELEPAR